VHPDLAANFVTYFDDAIEFAACEAAVHGKADEAALLGRCGREKDGAENATLLQRVAHGGGFANVARLQRDDLLLGGRDVVAELIQPLLQVSVVCVKPFAAPWLAFQHVEHRAVASHLVLHDGCAEDCRQRLVAEEFDVAPRRDDEAAAARHGLRQPHGAEVHAVGEASGDNEACAVGALCAEGVCFVDNEGGAVALTNLDKFGQWGKRAIRAVQRIDADEARTPLG